MTTSKTRARASRRSIAGVVVVAIILAGVDVVFVEPYRLEVTHSTVRARIHEPITIAHLSDLHSCGFGRHERKTRAALDAEKPDLIVVTGDSVGEWCKPDAQREVLSALHAPLGVFVVRGNWERAHPVGDPAFYASAGVTLLANQSAQIRDGLWIIGFDDAKTANPRIEEALLEVPPAAFTIGLYHSPALFDSLAGRIDLSLAGHTHGGQVRIPGLPALWLTTGSRPYLEGWYASHGSRLYVSRGIGTSTLPIRFFSTPELAILRLVPE